MYPFLTLEDNTEIVHSEMQPDGRVKVYIERPDEKYCFRHATCWLPDYAWENIYHFSEEEIDKFEEIIRSTAHLILEFSQEGGFENATKIWITSAGKTYLANNNSKIPKHTLRNIMRMIEARSDFIKQKWISYFSEIRFYC